MSPCWSSVIICDSSRHHLTAMLQLNNSYRRGYRCRLRPQQRLFGYNGICHCLFHPFHTRLYGLLVYSYLQSIQVCQILVVVVIHACCPLIEVIAPWHTCGSSLSSAFKLSAIFLTVVAFPGLVDGEVFISQKHLLILLTVVSGMEQLFLMRTLQ